tara:strand:- start:215 stop:559 length:345 start_codon:yes stop_codon:yes gene_type:complete
MTLQEPIPEPTPTNATQQVITAINSTDSLSRLIHEMAHTCITTEEFFSRLAGLLQVFWGDTAPEGGKLDAVVWLHVAIETMPPECMLPLFENSMAKLEGRKLEERKKHEDSGTS